MKSGGFTSKSGAHSIRIVKWESTGDDDDEDRLENINTAGNRTSRRLFGTPSSPMKPGKKTLPASPASREVHPGSKEAPRRPSIDLRVSGKPIKHNDVVVIESEGK